MSTPESNPEQAAEALYRAFRASGPGPDQPDFETFCAQHPVQAPQLRRLHAAHLSEQGAAATRVMPAADRVAGGEGPRRPGGPVIATPTATAGSRYRMEGEIARGGMGAILKVWDSDLHRALAMKVILGDEDRIADGSTAEIRLSRFLEEAQITGQLDHPGVVPVHELGVDKGGRVYFTMRLVKGRDLGEIIQKARTGEDGWNLTRAINVLHRVCETMAYAHAKGVVHRDLKPENVMVGQFGETYAMDWGLARVLGRPDGEAQRRRILANSVASFVRTDRQDQAADSDSGTRTQNGSVLGTPYYMPPEQAAGELETIGPQSDVYAMGAILYHLLTGKRPYEQIVPKTMLGIVQAVIEGPPIAVHRLDAKVPAELVAICERAMARAPEHRYPSMVDMAADLQAYLEFRVVHAYQSGAIAEFLKWVRRNRGFSAAIAALVLVAVVGLAGLAWTESEKAVAIAAAQERTQAARDLAVQNLREANEQGYLANVTAANASLAAGETVEARRHLANCLPELRGWEWRHLSLSADASVAVLAIGASGVRDLAVNATGTRLVVSAADGALQLWDLATREQLKPLAEGSGVDLRGGAPAVAFVDDGRRVVAIGRQQDSRVRVWNAASGDLSSRLTQKAQALYAVAVSPQGDRAALGVADHSIHIVDLRSGADVGQLVGHEDTLRALAFSEDGANLVSGAEDKTIRIWNVATRSLVVPPIPTAAAVYSLAFAPHNSQLAAGLEDGSVLRFMGLQGKPLEPLPGHRGAVYAVAFDGDATRLAAASFDKTIRVWDTNDGHAIAVLVGHEQPVQCVQFAAGTSVLASGSADGTVRLWDVARNRSTVTYRVQGDSYLAAVDISHDGSRVVIGSSWPGQLEVIDAATGTRVLQVPGPEDSVVALAFAPDDRRFAVAFQGESSVRICDLATGTLSEPMLGHEASVKSIAWSPDGSTIVSAAEDRTVRTWNVATGTARGAPWVHEQDITAVALDGDGRQVAVGTLAGEIHVHALDTGAELRVLAGAASRVLALEFAPKGSSLAAGYSDGSVRVFPADSPTPMELRGHEKRVSSLRYLPDGSRLVSGSFDGTLRVWDTATGRLALTLRDHTGPVTGVAVGGRDARIVSTSLDGTLQIRNTQRQAR